ncbi:MAG: PQQ-binding-like beta-propeller repeat protein, partial [Fidelibacterota bacterium]
WDIAGPTWVGGVRNGGGIWETPAIDPELGTLFFHVGNPSPDFDGSARKGMNLFTDSLVALDVITGELKWFFQEVHHDLWDYDGAASPILFDFRKDGQTIKAVATAPKNGSLYILDRTTGQPINPIIEVPVPTFSDVPGEEIFPTQPMPFTADGTPMEPIVSLLAVDVPPQYASFVVPHYTPPSSTEIHIVAPHDAIGGTNFAPLSFSPRTGLLYVTGMDLPRGDRVQPVGATIQPGQVSFPVFDEIDPGIRNGYVVAYDPATARLVWKRRLGVTQSGVVVTGGDVLFVGDAAGFFYALDARTGDVLYQFQTGAGIGAAPMVYELNGVEYVSVAAGGSNRQGLPLSDSVVTFTLFGQP